MAEQAAGAVASAVINGITDRAFSTVMRKLRSQSSRAAAHEKLQRLETLMLKLRCAVEVSEKHAIESASLLEWRDRLREAAAEGEAVVVDFQRRAKEGGTEAAPTSASAGVPGQQQQQQQPAGTLYFTRSALGGMAQRVRDATRRLFSTDEDMKKLDTALEKMERLSPDISQFLMALQLEVSPPAKRRRVSPPAQRRRVSPPAQRRTVRPRRSSCSTAVWDKSRRSAAKPGIVQLGSAEDPEKEARMLARELEPTLQCINSCIHATDDRDMEGLEWLAEWAALLREAVERGNAVLQTLSPGFDVIHKAGSGGALEADGELYSFARAVQRMALEEQCFTVLVDLCPTKQ